MSRGRSLALAVVVLVLHAALVSGFAFDRPDTRGVAENNVFAITLLGPAGGGRSGGHSASLVEPHPPIYLDEPSPPDLPTEDIPLPSNTAADLDVDAQEWLRATRMAIEAELESAPATTVTTECQMNLIVQPDGKLIGASADACALDASYRQQLVTAAFGASAFAPVPAMLRNRGIEINLELR